MQLMSVMGAVNVFMGSTSTPACGLILGEKLFGSGACRIDSTWGITWSMRGGGKSENCVVFQVLTVFATVFPP